METVSVIIPVYNTDKYLHQCLDSVICQTYHNLEIILIDDGSTDLSGKICDEYEKIDPRIKVIHKENGGVTSARNAGLLQTTGKYITFVDSDDWIDSSRVERMVDAMVMKKADLVYAPYRMHYKNGEFRDIIPNFQTGLYEEKAYEDLIGCLIDTNKFYHENLELTLWLIMFRDEVFRQVQFSVPNDIRIGEDVICIFGVLTKSRSMVILNAEDGVHYNYRRYLGSSSQIVCEDDCRGIKKLYETGQLFFQNYEHRSKLEKQVSMIVFLSLIARAYNIVMENEKFLFPFPQLVPGKKVAVYGAGLAGVSIVKYCMESRFTPIVLWVDKAFERYGEYYEKYGVKVENPSNINATTFDYLLISVTDYKIADAIERNMLEQGISSEKIVRFGNIELMTWEKLEKIFREIE